MEGRVKKELIACAHLVFKRKEPALEHWAYSGPGHAATLREPGVFSSMHC